MIINNLRVDLKEVEKEMKKKVPQLRKSYSTINEDYEIKIKA
jgi:hypothetical protein